MGGMISRKRSGTKKRFVPMSKGTLACDGGGKMELLYIDESGDNGFTPASSERFILAGLSIQASAWKEYFWKIVGVRQGIVQQYGLRIKEFKGSDLFVHRGDFFNTNLSRLDRIAIYNGIVDLLCDAAVNLFVVVCEKEKGQWGLNPQDAGSIPHKQYPRVFIEWIWKQYLSDYEMYLVKKTERTGQPENAILYFDSNPCQEKYIRRVVRNYTQKYAPEDHFKNTGIVEEIVFRDSKSSYMIQLADVLACSVNQMEHRREKELFLTETIRNRLSGKMVVKRLKNPVWK